MVTRLQSAHIAKMLHEKTLNLLFIHHVQPETDIETNGDTLFLPLPVLRADFDSVTAERCNVWVLVHIDVARYNNLGKVSRQKTSMFYSNRDLHVQKSQGC